MHEPLKHPSVVPQCQAAPGDIDDTYLRALLRLFAALACRLR